MLDSDSPYVSSMSFSFTSTEDDTSYGTLTCCFDVIGYLANVLSEGKRLWRLASSWERVAVFLQEPKLKIPRGTAATPVYLPFFASISVSCPPAEVITSSLPGAVGTSLLDGAVLIQWAKIDGELFEAPPLFPTIGDGGTSLSTPAIVGISVGSASVAVLGLLLTVAALVLLKKIFLVQHRDEKKEPSPKDDGGEQVGDLPMVDVTDQEPQTKTKPKFGVDITGGRDSITGSITMRNPRPEGQD